MKDNEVYTLKIEEGLFFMEDFIELKKMHDKKKEWVAIYIKEGKLLVWKK